MPLVCGVSRFAGQVDGQGFMGKLQAFISLLHFMEKLKVFLSLMEFITTFIHCVRKILPRFLRKLSFDTKLAEKNQTSPISK